jgi:hypothetical protein
MSPPKDCHVAIEANATDVMNETDVRVAGHLHRACLIAKLQDYGSYL